MGLNLTDDLGILAKGPEAPAPASSGKLNLSDDLGILSEKPEAQIRTPLPGERLIPQIEQGQQPTLLQKMARMFQSSPERKAKAADTMIMSEKSGIPPNAIESDYKRQATRFLKPPESFGPEDKMRAALDQGFAAGLIGTKPIYPEFQAEHPVLDAIGQGAGGLAGLVGTGAALEAVGVGPTVYKALFTKYGIKGMPLAATMARAVSSGTTFGVKTAAGEMLQMANDEKITLDSARQVLEDTAFGLGLGVTGSIAKPAARIPAEMFYGYTTAKLQGANDLNSLINAGVFGLFGILNRADYSKEYKIAAINEVTETMTKKAQEFGLPPDVAAQQAKSFVVDNLILSTGEIDQAKAWSKVMTSREYNLKYFDTLNENLKTLRMVQQLPPIKAVIPTKVGNAVASDVPQPPLEPQTGIVPGLQIPANGEILPGEPEVVSNPASETMPESLGEMLGDLVPPKPVETRDLPTKLNDEIVRASELITKPGESLEDNVARTKDWISSTLDNDEGSTNSELVDYFHKEGGFSKDVAEFIVSKRSEVRATPGGVKKEMKDAPDNISQAAQLGTAAFEAGKKAIPSQDPELMKLLEGVPVGEGKPVLEAWTKAWDKANGIDIDAIEKDQKNIDLINAQSKPAPKRQIKVTKFDIIPTEHGFEAPITEEKIIDVESGNEKPVESKKTYPVFVDPFSKENHKTILWATDVHKTGENKIGGSGWEWYGFKKISKDVYEGFVHGFEDEFGTFSLQELKDNGIHVVTDPDELDQIAPPIGWTKKETVQKNLTKTKKSAIPKVEGEAQNERPTEPQNAAPKPNGAGSGDTGRHQSDSIGRERGAGPRSEQSVQSSDKRDRGAEHHIESSEPDREREAGTYRITDADEIGVGSPKEKYKNNVAAISLLKQLESENRLATPDEQKILVKYVGWGGLSKVFDSWNAKGWEKEAKEIEKLLTDEEFRAARSSTINAHYTSPKVIQSIWTAVQGFGFNRGKVIEPAVGIGHFIGLRPPGVKASFTAIDLEPLSARITKQLYQHADTHNKGYQEVNLPKDFFDLAISNVPFADIKPFDPKAKYLGIPVGLSLHDFFFAKSLAVTKPGGIVAFVTSRFTMDKQDPRLRKWISESADLLGAIRLPSTAFKENAGTEVVTDIVFLRKRLPGESPTGVKWVDLGAGRVSNRPFAFNQYYIDNPSMVLGKPKLSRGMYSDNEYTLELEQGQDFDTMLKATIDTLPKDVIINTVDVAHKKEVEAPKDIIPDSSNLKQDAYTVKDGKIYQKVETGLQEVPLGHDTERMKGLIGIRDAVRDLLSVQLAGITDAAFKPYLETLNRRYDTFVKKHGYINSPQNDKLFWEDPDASLISAVEVLDKETKEYSKHNIFKERTIKPHVRPEKASSAKDAVYISLSEYGKLNWSYMSKLTGKPVVEIQKDLVKEGLLFKNPEGEDLELSDEYLSGNVKQKLKIAETAAKVDPAYTRNVEALKKVIPEDLPFHKIGVKIGVPWVEPEHYAQFIAELFDVNPDRIEVTHTPHEGKWYAETNDSWVKSGAANRQEWGTERMPALSIFEAVANGKVVKVMDKAFVDGKETRVLNEDETALAQDKAEIMKEKFKSWFWEDEARRNKYTALYNEEFNNTINRKHDGKHLTLPGMSTVYIPRKTQIDGIWRGVSTDRVLLAHEVGAGKTLTITGIVMESKRLGLINKAMGVVPNNTLPGWKSEWKKIYPGANILVADERNFSKDKRQRFLSKIATGNWDAVILSESAFSMVGVSDEAYKDFIEAKLDELRDLKEQQKAAGSKISVKDIERSILRYEEKLKARLDQSKKDKVVTFEELGIDCLFVDEADKFKNLAYQTKMDDVRGLGSPEGNDKTEDLMMKTMLLRNKSGKLIFATGTPISNTMAEVHNMMRYLQPELLAEHGLTHFDDWAKTFGEIKHSLEVDVTGARHKFVNRFSKFNNIKQLMTMLREVWDIQTADMLEEQGVLVKGRDLPLIKGGKAEVVLSESSEHLDVFKQNLVKRAEKAKGHRAEKGGDNMLVILHDGMLGTIDMRLINPDIVKDPGSKVEAAIEKITEIWKESKEWKGTQVVFLDAVKPDKTTKFNPQYYMKKQLIAKGIPAGQIAFIHDFDTVSKKTALYDAINKGQIRVIFGNTEKLGAGTNIQERLYALHHLDTGWRPRDIIQKEGRILRPGNTNKEVRIIRYIRKGSIDTFMWQLLEEKLRTINQAMAGKGDIDDLDESVDEYAIIKSMSSDNPLIKEKTDIDQQVRKLQALKNAFLTQKAKAQATIKTIPEDIVKFKKWLADTKEDIAKRPDKLTKDNFTVKINGTEYTDKGKAWAEINKRVAAVPGDQSINEPIGEYQGFPLRLTVERPIGDIHRKVYIEIQGKGERYNANFSESDIGTFQSIDNTLYAGLDDKKAFYERTVKEKGRELEALTKISEGKFEKEDEFEAKTKRKIEIDRILRTEAKDKPVASGEEEVQGAKQPGAWGVNMSMAPETQKSINKTEILTWAEKAFKVPIRGKATTRMTQLAGAYHTKSELIRLKQWGDLWPMTHELAHHIDKKMKQSLGKYWRGGATSASRKGIVKELQALDYEPAKKRTSEGFAEFIRYYLTTDQAEIKAPAFYRFFTQRFLPDHADISGKLKELKGMLDTWQKQGAENRVIEQIDFAQEHTHPGDLGQKIKGAIEKSWDWVNRNFNDEFFAIEDIEKQMGIKPGVNIRPTQDPFTMATYVKSKSGVIARTFVMEKAIDEYGKVLGPGLSDILKPIKSEDMKKFISYGVAKRALLLADRHIVSGIDLDDARFIANKYKSETWDKAIDDITVWANHLLDWVIRAGGLGTEEAALMRELNPIYLPFKRAFVDEIGVHKGVGNSFVNKGAAVKAIKGSGRPIINPLESLVAQASEMILKAQKINIARLIADMAAKEGVGGFITKVPAPMEVRTVTLEQLKSNLDDMGIDVGDADLDQVLTVFTQSWQYRGKDNIVSFWKNGKREFYELHPELYRALSGIDNLQRGVLLKILGPFSRILRLGATGIKVSFGLIRNPWRDALSYAVLSKHKTAIPLLDTATGVFKELTAKPGDLAWRFKNAGGSMSGMMGYDRAATMAVYDDLVNEKLKASQKIIKTVKNPISALLFAIDKFRGVLNISELGPRIAELDKSYAQYRKEKPDWTEEDCFVAAFNDAQDVTINFTKSGYLGKRVNEATAFFNANLRGFEKTYRSVKENPVRFIVKGLAWLTAFTVLNWLRNHDKQWYKNLPPAYRYGNVFIEIDDQTIIRLPIPFEVGMIFMSAPAAALDSLEAQDPKYIASLKELVQQQSPVRWPSAMQPIWDVASNKNYYGTPIESKDMEYLPKEERKRSNTSRLAIGIAQGLKGLGIESLSPVQIEYLMQQYTGGAIKQIPQGKINELSDSPVLSDILINSPENPKGQLGEFYDEWKILNYKRQTRSMKKGDLTRYTQLKVVYNYLKISRKQAKDFEDKGNNQARDKIYRKIGKVLEKVGF